MHYILDDDNTVVQADIMEWAEWIESHNRTVGRDHVNGLVISTVFLGLDHSYGYDQDPLVFETMVFDKDGDEIETIRCSLYEEAVEQHKIAVKQWSAQNEIP